MRQCDIEELLASSPEPAFVVGPQGLIRCWNASAVRVFGRPAKDALLQPCAQILAGRHPSGPGFCESHCPLLDSAAQGKPIPPSEISVAVSGGERRAMRMLSLTARNQLGEPLLVHLLHDIENQKRLNATVHHFIEQIASLSDSSDGGFAGAMQLTVRERLILELLIEGRSTAAIARQLHVTPATVRNHIQHVLHKLSAHTRLEAVLVALRKHLV
ncbi:MAG: PAS domain-containing protein [Bryobacterales bacterium]|nr:PAS domain-containing protein [Bryobacterales bacterium]